MESSLSYSCLFVMFSILVFLFFVLVLLVCTNIKIQRKKIKKAERKGLGKPIEDLEELKKVLCDKNIFILFFIPESNCGIFLAGTKINDVTGEGIIYCKIDKWEVSDAFDSMNPKSGKTYKFSVVDGISLFTQV